MHRSCFAVVIVLGVIGPFSQQAFGQARAVDVRAIWGYSYLLDDSPPYALVGGVSVTAAFGSHFRVGAELVKANLFGPDSRYKSRARIGRGLLEYELRPGSRLNPYWVVGVGITEYRDLIPVGYVHVPGEGWVPSDAAEWEVQPKVNLTGGIGVRLLLTDHIFIAPEARIGVAPLLQTTIALGVGF